MEKTTQAPGHAPTATALKKFNQHCKDFNLFTLENLPEILFETQCIRDDFKVNYTDKINSAKIETPSEILNDFGPVLLFEVREQINHFTKQTELIYIDHIYTAFCTPAGNIAILRKPSYKGDKYEFMLHYSHYRQVQNIAHYKRERAQKEANHTDPQKIGVFTHKKVLNWLEHCDKEEILNAKIVEQANDKNKEIEAQIKDFATRSGGTVTAWHDNTQVKCKYFTVIFEHNRRDQYLSTKIEYTGSLNQIIKLESCK